MSLERAARRPFFRVAVDLVRATSALVERAARLAAPWQTSGVTKGRLEAFSDGVLAVAITIMVLELRPPDGDSLASLVRQWPAFVTYALSFVYVGIYWNNHHHLMLTVTRIDGRVMWANHHLLFWLALLPVSTAWQGAHPRSAWPTAFYGVILFLSAVAWVILQREIIRVGGTLREAIGRDLKGKLSPTLYALGIGFAFVEPIVSQALYAIVALLWLAPDRRIEARIEGGPPGGSAGA